MIVLGTIGIRYLELAVLFLTAAALVLIFLRRRPPGLVWFSALAVGTLAVHLYLDQGRWQFIPAALLLLILSFWLARPTGGHRAERHGYGAVGLSVRIVMVLVAVPSLGLPFIAPVFIVPPPGGPHNVGSASILLESERRLQVWYPTGLRPESPRGTVLSLRRAAETARSTPLTVAPYWSSDELARHRLPGLPWLFSTHLTLVPTPALHRAPVLDEQLPLLVMVPGESALPGDFLRPILEAASSGWFVVEAPAGSGEQQVADLVRVLVEGQADAAFAGRVDAGRVALLRTGAANEVELGLPYIHIAGRYPLQVATPGRTFAVTLPGAAIPAPAFTTRHLMVNPSRLLVGSSDVSPSALSALLVRAAQVLLADGDTEAPIFSGSLPDQERLLADTPGAAIHHLQDGR